MATKLRDFNRLTATKVIVFILTVIAITSVAVMVQYLTYQDIDPESVLIKEYKDSNDFIYDLTSFHTL